MMAPLIPSVTLPTIKPPMLLEGVTDEIMCHTFTVP